MTDAKVGVCFGSQLHQRRLQSAIASTIMILSSSRIEWYTVYLVGVKFKADPEVKVRSHFLGSWIGISFFRLLCGSARRQSAIWETDSYIHRFGSSVLSEWCLWCLSRLYLNLIGSYWRKTVMTRKDHCDVISDVSQTQIFQNKVGRRGCSVWQQHVMCMRSDYNIYVAKWAISAFPNRVIMGEITWMPWPQMTCTKILHIQNVSTQELFTFWKLYLADKDCLLLSALQSCSIL